MEQEENRLTKRNTGHAGVLSYVVVAKVLRKGEMMKGGMLKFRTVIFCIISLEMIYSAALANSFVTMKGVTEAKVEMLKNGSGSRLLMANAEPRSHVYDTNAGPQKSVLKEGAPRKTLLDQVAEDDGVKEEFEVLLRLSLREPAPTKPNRALAAQIAQMMKKHLSENLNEKDLINLRKWLDSALHRKLVRSNSTDDIEKGEEYLEKLIGTQFEERLKWATEIDRRTGASQLAIIVADRLGNDKRSDTPLPSDEENNDASWYLYQTRYLSHKEFRQYLQFLDSPSGKKFSTALVNAVKEALWNSFDEADRKMSLIKKLAALPPDSSKEFCEAYANELNRKVPSRIDEVTILTGVSCESTTLLFNYKLKTSRNPFADPESAIKAMKASVCGRQVTADLINKGIALRYVYTNNSGAPIISFLVVATDCAR